MSQRSRYFEHFAYRDISMSLWKKDSRVQLKSAPKPTMKTSMYNTEFMAQDSDKKLEIFNSCYQSSLNDEEMAFDAADIIRVGKDVFIKKGQTANNLSIDWLRREFPNQRFHMMHVANSWDRHCDSELLPLRPPTSGS